MIHPAELVGVGVDVDEQLVGMVGGDQLVAVGGGLRRGGRRRPAAGRRRGCAAAASGWGRSRAGRHRRRSCWRSHPGGGRRRRWGCRGGRRRWRNDAPHRAFQSAPPMIATGLVASFNRSNSAPIAPAQGGWAIGAIFGRSIASTSSRSMSSGSASTTGPGRPAVATRKARATYSGMRRASSIRAAHLAIGPKKAAMSISWKPSRSLSARSRSPTNRIIGVESWKATWTPAVALVAPGPAGDEGDAGLAGHLAVGIGHVGDPAFLPADDQCRSPARRAARRARRGSFRPAR